ncbi:MAG: HD-GYP domain-containing protein [Deferribacterales bacterium]
MKKVSVVDLKIGDKVVKLDKNWLDTGFFSHKFLIKDQSVIDKLKSSNVDYVYIEYSEEEESIKELYSGNAESVINRHKEDIKKNYINLDEVKNAKVIYTESVKVVKSFMEDIRTGALFKDGAIKAVASNIAEITMKSKGVLASVTKLKHYDNYTFQHSMNVGIFASSLAAHLGMSHRDIERIAKAGLLHDVGKMLVPQEILNKPGKLTEEEFRIMKSHVQLGYDFLVENGVPEDMLNLTLQHHERHDGSGYPNGLKDEEISIEGKIGAVVDIYDAITSDRCYHKGMEAAQALRLMFKWTDSHINRKVFDFFVMNVGIYPVGSLVLMDTNELGVIGRINHNKPTNPTVLIFSDKMGREKPIQIVDLSVSAINKRKILGPVNPADIKIPSKVYAYIEKMNEIK